MPITRRRPKLPAAPSDKPTAKNPLSRRCKNCPKMFTATRDQHYFCSEKCRKEFHDDRRPKRPAAPSDKPTAKNPLSRRCKNCPKMFTATRDQHYFCSAKCRKAFHEARRPKRPARALR